jgi:hypothetical protein
VTDFQHGYLLEENDTLVFNVDSLYYYYDDNGVESEQSLNSYDCYVDTADELDYFVTVREVGPNGTDVAIWFDSQGADYGDETPNPDDARTPQEDIIVIQGIGSGQGKINSLHDLVEANYNVEVNCVDYHFDPEYVCYDNYYSKDFVV